LSNLIGLALGRYNLLEKLGDGGMAVVYKAYDTHLECEVAVKVIRTDHLGPAVLDRALKRFELEAKAVARLDHPNIIKVTDYGEYEGKPYLVMPYLPGGTLKQYITHNTRISWLEASQLLVPVAEALGYAHEQRLIHRDVKPSNIMLISNGIPMLTDFGVAKVLDEEMTRDLTGTAATVGTPEYMAPEQVMSKTVDHRADIYALGVVFFEMITGRRPYEADTPMAVLVKHASAPPPRPQEFLPDLPFEVERVLLKALQKDPANRYQSMAEFAAALVALEKTIVVAPPPQITPETSGPAVPHSDREIRENYPSSAAPSTEGTVDALLPASSISGGSHSWVRILAFSAGGIILLGLLITALLSGWFSGKPQQQVTKEPLIETEQPASLQPTKTSVPPTPTTIRPTPTPAVISPLDGMTMILIPAGEFMMGAAEDVAVVGEGPQHKVYLDAYWIDMTEVTNEQYAKCVEAGACEKPVRQDSVTRSLYFGNPEYADYPVIYINYPQAIAYCEWAGRRIPTEAEWEKAARGEDPRKYPWGNTYPTGNLANFADRNTSYKWSDSSVDDGFADTAPVNSYPQGASSYGVLNMAGNVWEWVADWYSQEYYRESAAVNPTGPDFGYHRVLRGGSWGDSAAHIRSTYRYYLGDPTDTTYDFGIRCVQDAN